MDDPLLQKTALLALLIARNASILVTDLRAWMNDSLLNHIALLALVITRNASILVADVWTWKDRFCRRTWHTSFRIADQRAYDVFLRTSFGGKGRCENSCESGVGSVMMIDEAGIKVGEDIVILT